MNKIIKYIPLAVAALLFSACQNNDEENFANKGFINEKTMTSETIIKGDVQVTKKLNICIARPVEKAVNATFAVDKAMVDTYNKAYYATAELLPEDCYKVIESNVTINPGSVKSNDASIEFFNLAGLDREKTFVLPVTVNTADVELLASSKTYYYIFRAGALINVVAEMYDATNKKATFAEVNWATPDLVSSMDKLTMEALIYVRNYGKLISTVMGIEGQFLIRIGDAGFPDNQIQIATSRGNFPQASADKGLPSNQWVHIALTYDASTSEMIVYVNGKEQSKGTMNIGNVNIKGNGSDRNFLFGKSYDDNRWLDGYISEARVWNVVRTQEEIANNFYTVDPTTPGLVGYWKFDDENGYLIHDYSGNGNDAKVPEGYPAIGWYHVSLPATK